MISIQWPETTQAAQVIFTELDNAAYAQQTVMQLPQTSQTQTPPATPLPAVPAPEKKAEPKKVQDKDILVSTSPTSKPKTKPKPPALTSATSAALVAPKTPPPTYAKASSDRSAPEPAALDEPEQVANQNLDRAIALATQFLEPAKPARSSLAIKKEVPALPKQSQSPSQITGTTSGASTEAQKLTLAQLTQGFMHHISQEQNDADSGPDFDIMEVKSNHYGAVSMKQLSFINYNKKILSCVATSYRINKSNCPRIEQPQIMIIQLVLNRDGSINDLSILQSSGNVLIDQFISFLFTDAATSFPPIPSSFPTPFVMPPLRIPAAFLLQFEEAWSFRQY